MAPAPRAFAWLAAALLTPAAAQVTHVPITEPLRLAGPLQPVKGGAAVYIVKLRDPGAASYKRAPTDLSATKPADVTGGARVAAADAYAKQLEQTHDRLLGGIGAASAKLYSYRYSVNGFAARLTAAQVSRLAQSAEVERIWQDTDQYLQTNNSPTFLGLQDPDGRLAGRSSGCSARASSSASSIAASRPSIRPCSTPRTVRRARAAASGRRRRGSASGSARAYRRNPPTEVVYDPPVGFTGACQAGDGFGPRDCNNKVVGARFYLEGFLARHTLDPGEFRSPRDVDGHGTHIATIVAGNSVDASLLGARVGARQRRRSARARRHLQSVLARAGRHARHVRDVGSRAGDRRRCRRRRRPHQLLDRQPRNRPRRARRFGAARRARRRRAVRRGGRQRRSGSRHDR